MEGTHTSWASLFEELGCAEKVRHVVVQLRREGALSEGHPPREVLVRELPREGSRRCEHNVLEDRSYHAVRF